MLNLGWCFNRLIVSALFSLLSHMTDINEIYVLIFLEIPWTLSEIRWFSNMQIDLVAIINNFRSKQISLSWILRSRQKTYIKMKIIP